MFLVLLVFSAQTAAKPVVEWNVLIGGERRDEAWCVKETVDHGFILAGVSWSFGSGDSDIYLVKTDSEGTVEWNKSIGGDGDDFGSTVSLAPLGYIVGGYVTVSGLGEHPFVAIVDEIGNQRWNYTFLDASGIVESIMRQGEGYIVACSSYTENRAYFIHLTSDGDLLGVEVVELPGPVNAVESSGDGFIVTGTVATDENGLDAYLAKINLEYEVEWTSNLGGALNEVPFAVDSMREGYLVCGYQVSPRGDYDLYMVKTDEKGEEIASVVLGDALAQWSYHGVAVGDRVLVTGMNTSGIENQSGFYVLQADNLLNMEWVNAFGLGTGTYCNVTSDGGVIVTGTSLKGGYGGKDVRLVKISQEPRVEYYSLILVLLVIVIISVVRGRAWSRLK